MENIDDISLEIKKRKRKSKTAEEKYLEAVKRLEKAKIEREKFRQKLILDIFLELIEDEEITKKLKEITKNKEAKELMLEGVKGIIKELGES